jgi:hypothetical protein
MPDDLLNDDFDLAFDDALKGDDGVATPEPEVVVADPVVEAAPEPEVIAPPPVAVASTPEPPKPVEPEAVKAPEVTFNVDDLFDGEMSGAEWENLKDDYPAVAEYLQSIKGREKERTKKIYDEVIKAVTERFAPLEAQVAPIVQQNAQNAQTAFVSTIQAAHADATQLLPEVEKWIGTLPRHRQIGANEVLDRGTAQDVIDLFTEFKDLTGRTKPVVPPPQVDQSRLRKLEPVSRIRPKSVDEAADPNDFAGAFEEAMARNVA